MNVPDGPVSEFLLRRRTIRVSKPVTPVSGDARGESGGRFSIILVALASHSSVGAISVVLAMSRICRTMPALRLLVQSLPVYSAEIGCRSGDGDVCRAETENDVRCRVSLEKSECVP